MPAGKCSCLSWEWNHNITSHLPHCSSQNYFIALYSCAFVSCVFSDILGETSGKKKLVETTGNSRKQPQSNKMVMWTVGIKLYCLLMSGFSKFSDHCSFHTTQFFFFNLLGSHIAQYFIRKNLQQCVLFTKCMHEIDTENDLSLAVDRLWCHFQSKHAARLWGCVPVNFFMPFTR